MPVEVIDASGKLLQVKVRGTLQRAEYEKMLQLARQTIAREGTMRVLAFTAAGFRPTAIEFFAASQLGKRWLST